MPAHFSSEKLRSTVAASLRESSIIRIVPSVISGKYFVPQIPCMVFRFPPMSVPVAAPGCSVTSALTRPFLALSWEFQSINSSVHCGGVGRV